MSLTIEISVFTLIILTIISTVGVTLFISAILFYYYYKYKLHSLRELVTGKDDDRTERLTVDLKNGEKVDCVLTEQQKRAADMGKQLVGEKIFNEVMATVITYSRGDEKGKSIGSVIGERFGLGKEVGQLIDNSSGARDMDKILGKNKKEKAVERIRRRIPMIEKRPGCSMIDDIKKITESGKHWNEESNEVSGTSGVSGTSEIPDTQISKDIETVRDLLGMMRKSKGKRMEESEPSIDEKEPLTEENEPLTEEDGPLTEEDFQKDTDEEEIEAIEGNWSDDHSFSKIKSGLSESDVEDEPPMEEDEFPIEEEWNDDESPTKEEKKEDGKEEEE